MASTETLQSQQTEVEGRGLAPTIEEEKTRIRELSALNRIATSVNSTLDLDRVLDLVVREAQEILEVQSCSLVLCEDRTNDLVFKVGFGMPEGEERQIHLSKNQGIVGWVAREARPALVNDVSADPRWFDGVDKLTGFVTRSIAAFPVIANGKVIGVIEAINKVQGNFLERDLQLLESISAAVSTAIQNARLFGELNRAHSELGRIHQLVLESRNTLRALIDGITDRIWIVDRSLKITAINKSAAQSLGLLPAHCIGLLCCNILCGRQEPCDQCPASETFERGTENVRVETQRKSDGAKRDYEVHTYPLRDETGKVDKVIYIVQDITSRRRMEAALLQSARLSAVGELAAGVAHDISNPITAVIANAQMILQNMDVHDHNRRMVESIERAGKRSEKAARNLLNLSRQDEYIFVPTDLNATIEQALALVSPELARRQIRVVQNLGELPLIQASGSHLETVWTNLVLNARDAIVNDSSGEILITSRYNAADRSVQVLFVDSGVGMAERDLDRIFEPFFTTKPRDQGTGLGLYVSRVVVTEHMGTIEALRNNGSGMTFTVTLPVDGPSEEHRHTALGH